MVILLIIASCNEVPTLISGADEASTDPTSLEDPKHRKY
jgi:hypothetical protein